MSDQAADSDHGTDGTGGQSVYNYKASWISHWKHTSFKPSIKKHNDLPLSNGLDNDGSDLKQHVSHCGTEKATQGLRELSEVGKVDIMDKSLKMSAIKLGKESLDGQPSLVFNVSQNQESDVAINNNWGKSYPNEVKCQLYPRSGNETLTLGRSKWVHPETECNHLQPKGILWDHEQLVRSHGFLEKNSLAASTSFQPDVRSTSNIEPHGFNSEGAEIQSFMCHQEEIDQSILRETSTSHNQLPTFLNKQCQKGEDDCGIRLLQSRVSHPEVMKSVKGYHECSSVPRIPFSVLDVETMRILTSIDSMEDLPSSPPKFSQTTREFFITKKNDVNLSSLGQVLRDSKDSSRLKGKMSGDFLTLSPSFSFQGQHDVNLQPLWRSSTDSEGGENAGNVKTSAVCLQNESSTETDAMELDFFQKRQLSGIPVSPPNQKIEEPQNSSTSQTPIASAREETVERIANTNTDLPDINQEPFTVPVAASLVDERETSPSRTLSLDAEHLLSHAEQPTDSKSTACPDAHLGTELRSRWIKRLRVGSSDSLDHATKRSKTGESSSQEKVKEIFSKSLKCSMTSSGPSEGRCQVKPCRALDQTVMLLKNGDSSSSTDLVRKSHDITLSHSWIQRWAKNGAASPKRKPKTMALCEPKSSKEALDEYQKKQFPSIAAMALMGKTMSGFHPCEFKRRGSLIVWNT
ncbi:hypothetical protein SLEP1_g31142 [Rubroshorea leprosula]|uniref:F-box protein n=1 Tax=Rubroshorea leprosula TaxID=152421 RepID=A0AAV5KA10_9ROSI|nr:hypothetical protein SLEP1_g31142 [Rubroshorea leprosula]